MKESSAIEYRRWRSTRSVVRRALEDRAGNAIVELALVLSFLGIPLLLGTIETATLLFKYNEITNAAHVGAVYGMRSSTFASDSAGIIAAARAEAPDIGTNLSVTPTAYYACSSALDGTQYSNQSDAKTACTGGVNHSLHFIQVSVSAPITPPALLPGLPKHFTLKGVSVMEVQE